MIQITKNQIHLIQQLPNRCEKIVAFGMIYLSCLYADDDGEYNAKEFTLSRLTKVSNRQIESCVNKLIDLQYIECVYRNKLKQVEYSKRKYSVSKFPNRYKLQLLQPTDKVFYTFEMLNFKTEENILSDFWTCYSEYLTANNLIPTRREKEKIKIFVKSIDIKDVV